ncbi:MAG: hypothetical protein EOM90_02325, partial [Alphaproteobacteria bacterium]|nr:hypothetical protein [Alphaproteobacteria bacterium]
MKRESIIISICLIMQMSIVINNRVLSQTSTLNFSNNPMVHGLHSKREVINQNASGVEIEYSIPGGKVINNKCDSISFSFLNIEGFGNLNYDGRPALPVHNDVIAVPANCTFRIEIVTADYQLYQNYYIHPAIGPLPNTILKQPTKIKLDSSIYSLNEFFPSEIVSLKDIQEIRNVKLAIIQVCPVQFNPQSKEIKVFNRIIYRVSFQGNEQTFNSIATNNSQLFLNYLKNIVLNNSCIPNESVPDNSNGPRKDYIIITHSNYIDAANSLAKWKRQLGYSVEVVSRSSWTTQQVKDSIHLRYSNWNPHPDYFVIIGDHENVPGEMMPHPYSQSTDFPSDLYYAEMTGGNDYTPEMAHGRISVSSATEANQVIQKIIDYEANPPTAASYYTNSLLCTFFQDDDDNDGYEDRRFTRTTEEIHDYLGTKGYSANRVYFTQDNVTPKYWNDGAYGNGEELPSYLKKPTFTWDGDDTDIISSINAGQFLVAQRDHGDWNAWSHPAFDITDINDLNNNNLYPIVLSISCLTGKFSQSECFAETFIRRPSSGCAGIVAASEVSYSGPNEGLELGIIDAIWPGLSFNFTGTGGTGNQPSLHSAIFEMGMVLNQGLSTMIQTWGGESTYLRLTHELFHYHGDPASKIWTQQPTTITASVSLPVGGTNVNISNCNIIDALVTLCYNNEIFGTTTLADGNGSIAFTGIPNNSSMIVTISKYNCRPLIVNLTYQTAYSHDYSITSLTPLSSNPIQGQTITLNATLKNVGLNIEPSGQQVKFYVDGIEKSVTTTIPSLAPNASTPVNFSWIAENGAHNLKVQCYLSGDMNPANDYKEIPIYVGQVGNLLIDGETNPTKNFSLSQGTNGSYALQLQNNGSATTSGTVSKGGNQASWITLLSGTSFSVNASQTTPYNYKVTVPSGTANGAYSATITFTHSQGINVVTLNINVVQYANGMYEVQLLSGTNLIDGHWQSTTTLTHYFENLALFDLDNYSSTSYPTKVEIQNTLTSDQYKRLNRARWKFYYANEIQYSGTSHLSLVIPESGYHLNINTNIGPNVSYDILDKIFQGLNTFRLTLDDFVYNSNNVKWEIHTSQCVLDYSLSAWDNTHSISTSLFNEMQNGWDYGRIYFDVSSINTSGDLLLFNNGEKADYKTVGSVGTNKYFSLSASELSISNYFNIKGDYTDVTKMNIGNIWLKVHYFTGDPNLTCTKALSASSVNANENVTVNLTFNNVGSNIADEPEYNDSPLPSGLTLVSGTLSDGLYDIDPGETIIASYVIMGTSPGNYTFGATNVLYQSKGGTQYQSTFNSVNLTVLGGTLNVSASTNKNEYLVGEQVLISATVTGSILNNNVTDAAVQCTITLPDNSSSSIYLLFNQAAQNYQGQFVQTSMPGTYTINISAQRNYYSNGALNPPLTFIVGTPTINVSTSLLPSFGNVVVNTTSFPQNFSVSGNFLSSGITINAPSGFEISLNGTTGFSPSLTLPLSGSSIPNTNIYVRFYPTVLGPYFDQITQNSTNATPRTVTVTGTGICQSFSPTFTTSPGSTTCAGTNVTYTTQLNQTNYIWVVPGVLNTDYSITTGGTGSTNNTLTLKWLTAGSKTVTVNYTNSSGCFGTSPASSTTSVNLLGPVSVTISPFANPVCSGKSVVYTATSINGGTSPSYQWQVNGTNAGTGNPFNYTPANGNQIVCVLTSNAACVTNNPATSNTVTMTVNTQPVPSFTVSPGTNTCSGTEVTYTTQSGQSNYQWTVPGILNSDYSISSGGTGTTSNTVTLKWLTTGSKQVVVNYTNSNGCAGASPATSTTNVNARPVPSFSSSPGSSICINTNVTYTTQSGQSAYAWSVPGVLNADYSITSGGVGSSNYTVTLKWLTTGSKTVPVNYTNSAGCTGLAPASSSSTVYPIPAPTFTASPGATTCSNTDKTYTTQFGQTNYQWTVPGTLNTDYTITAGGISSTDHTVTLKWLTSGTKIVTVHYSNAGGCSGSSPASSSTNVVLRPVPTFTAFPGASTCTNTDVTYTTQSGQMNYIWTVPGVLNTDYSITSGGTGGGSSSVTLKWLTTGTKTVTVNYTNTGGCSGTTPASSTTAVNTTGTVSIAVSASANPVCPGASVIFIATPTNGGHSPSYQWKVNGNSVGSGNPVYTYVPSNNDAVLCILTSNAACITGNPATSNTIIVTYSALPVPTFTVTPPATTCSHTDRTYPTQTGQSNYTWTVPGTLNTDYSITSGGTGTTNHTVTLKWLTAGIKTVTVNYANANGCMGTTTASHTTSVVLRPVPSFTSAPGTATCANTDVNYTTQSGQVNYIWSVPGTVNTDYTITSGGTGGGSSSLTLKWLTSGNKTVTVNYSNSEGCSGLTPATSTTAVNTTGTVSVTISASANPVCPGTLVTFTAIPTNGGPSPSYQWKVNGANAGTSNPTYSYAPANGDAITCELTSNATCISNTTAISNAVTMVVIPSAPVSVSISPSANPVCSGSTVIFTATPTNGGSSPGFQWKKNNTPISGATNSTYTYTPANNDIITCVLTSNVVCPVGNPATSNAINMSVTTSIPAGVSILASTNNVCAGTTVHFTAYPVNGGTSPGYQWKKNGVPVGTNQPTYSCVPQNFDVINCTLTSNLPCASGNPVTSNAVIMNITTPAVVGVLIYASANPSCSGAPVTYTATASNQGTTPVYRWMKNGITVGSNSSAYSYIPSAGDLITCELTSNATCIQNPTAISNVITTALIPSVPVSVSIIASANPVCSGTPVTFTASSVNGGNTPVYQWKKNGTEMGSNSPVLTYAPGNGDVITCTLISSVNCPTGSPATSNAITMGVNTSLAAGISVVPSANPACQGSTVTFTAAPVNGGTAPVYQWKVNGINVGVNTPAYSFVPLNNDQVWCEMTSNLGCATGNPALSNTITMVMQQIYPVALTVSASANPVCVGSQVIFTAHPVNGGAAPAYQWKRNGIITGTNDPVLSLVPDNNDLITCQVTSSELCTTGNPAVSNQVIMTVNPNLQPGVTVTVSENPVCNGTPVSFAATPVNGGSSPGYQWRVNNTLVGTNNPSYTYIPSDNDYIVCDLVSNASCITGNPATSNVIRMSVDNQLFVGVSITVASSTVCIGSPAYFTAHPVNGGLSPVYQWRINGINAVSAGSTFSYIPMQGDVVTCEMTSGISCAINNPVFSNPIEMTTVQPVPVSVSITTPLSTVCQGRPITYTAFHINGGPAPSYQWKVNEINAGTNNQFFTYIPSNGDVVSCILTTSLSCVTNTTATSNVIHMTVDPLQPVSLAITPSANPVLPGTAVTFTATWT